MTHKLFIAAMILLAPAQARGECPEMAHELNASVKRLWGVINANTDAIAYYTSELKSCESQGAALSAKIASAAAGLSCQALLDSQTVYAEMQNVGQRCTTTFVNLADKHKKIEEELSTEQGAAAGALALLLRSPLLRQICPNEIKTAAVLQKALEQTNTQVAAMHALTVDSAFDYSSFSKVADNMRAKAGSANTNCGQLANQLAKGTHGNIARGVQAPAPAGAHDRGESTITGRTKIAELAGPRKSRAVDGPDESGGRAMPTSTSIDRITAFQNSNTIPRTKFSEAPRRELASVGSVVEAMAEGLEASPHENGSEGKTPREATGTEEHAELHGQARAAPPAGEERQANQLEERNPGQNLEAGQEAVSFSAGILAHTGHAGATHQQEPLKDATLFQRVHSCYERSWGTKVIIPLPGARLIVDGSL